MSFSDVLFAVNDVHVGVTLMVARAPKVAPILEQGHPECPYLRALVKPIQFIGIDAIGIEHSSLGSINAPDPTPTSATNPFLPV